MTRMKDFGVALVVVSTLLQFQSSLGELRGYPLINREMALRSNHSQPGWGKAYDSTYMAKDDGDALSGERRTPVEDGNEPTQWIRNVAPTGVSLDGTAQNNRKLRKKKQGQKQKAAAKKAEIVEEDLYLSSTPYPIRLEITWRQENKTPELEFVHIPKTGGTAVEAAGVEADVQWGFCHYSRLFHCKTLNMTNHNLVRQCNDACWHETPSKRIKPYKGKALFAVVRNPYARILSEYYCPFTGHKGGPKTPETLNDFIQYRIKKFHKGGRGGREVGDRRHMQPQSNFVFDFKRQNQLVKHVIFYENIGHELNTLFQNYGTKVRLGTSKTNKGHYEASSKMSVESLTPETIGMLNEFYRRDFEFLGYRMIDPEMGLGSNHSQADWGKAYDFNSIYMTKDGGDALSGERRMSVKHGN